MKALPYLICLCTAFITAAGCSSTRKIPLTPALVVDGGYIPYRSEKTFTEENGEELIRENVKCDLTKAQIHNKMLTFIAMNDLEVKYSDSTKIIAYVKYDVGNEILFTPVGSFNRNASKIEYYITLVIKDDGEYQLTAKNFLLERRRMFSVSSVYIFPVYTYIDVNFRPTQTKGTPNYLQNNRINYLIFERNAYVDLVIKERKYLRRMRERYREKIAQMDERINYETALCDVELQSVTDFLDKIKRHIATSDF